VVEVPVQSLLFSNVS